MKSHSNIVFRPKNLLFVGYLVVVSAFLVLLIEIALWGVDTATGGKLPVLVQATYPSNPGQWLKIAIFGGSSAKGFNAEYGFAAVLFDELDRRFGHHVYIKNYAREGFPFHRYQAEILKANICRYDFFLIYAGHNELHNYLDRVGKLRKPEFREHRMIRIKPGDDWSLLHRVLDEHSRLYAFLWRYNQISLDDAVKAAGGWTAPIRVKEFMSEGMLPPEERQKIDTNFQADMEEIGRLAQKHNKHVIIMSVPSCEDWKPAFSVRNNSLSPEASATWWNEYRRGESLYREGKFNEALSCFRTAEAIDGGVAILNYWIGMTLGKLSRLEGSHKYLRMAIDKDGFPVRALNSLSAIAESVARQYPNIHYCDTVRTFEDLVDHGCQWRHLFVDFQHPSFAGHVVIANGYLANIEAIKPFGYQSLVLDCGKLKDLVAFYHQKFGFSQAEQAVISCHRINWACNTADISAYPEDFLSLAEENLRLFFDNSDKGTLAIQQYEHWTKVIQARRAERLTDQ